MRKIITACIGFATLAGTLVFAESERPDSSFGFHFAPDGKRLLYYAYRGNSLPDIFLKQKGSSDEHEINLTQSRDVWDIEPNFSPDGESIVYSSGESMASMALRIMKADGNHDRELIELDNSLLSAKWSPDGNKIAFNSFVRLGEQSYSGDIYLINKDGSHLTNLTADLPGQARRPSWSEDGKTIYFNYSKDGNDVAEIYKMDTHGGHVQQLTELKAEIFDFVILETEKTVFFVAEHHDTTDIFMARLDGESPTKKLHVLPDSRAEKQYFLMLSPDGKHLIYSSGEWETGFTYAHRPLPTIKH